jgi:hypothetical protein
MAVPRHKRDTRTFEGLTFSEQAKSISAQLANLERAIRRHAVHPRATAKTATTLLKQVERFGARVARALA